MKMYCQNQQHVIAFAFNNNRNYLELAQLLKGLQPVMQSGDNKFSKFKQLKDMQEKRNEDFKTVFTKEQYELYKDQKDKLIGNRKEPYKNKQ